MKKSDQKILTTHTGSLPRPADWLEMLQAREAGRAVDRDRFAERARSVVVEAVRAQVEAGIDLVSDGEMTKISYATYVKDRLTGFAGADSAPLVPPDVIEFPTFAERMMRDNVIATVRRPSCTGPITYVGRTALREQLAALRAATAASSPHDAFVTAASPGTIALFFDNHHYADEEAYVLALAGAMREEYEHVVDAGFVLQLDCPDLGFALHRERVELHLAALDAALSNVPPDQVRLHVCYGNYEGPHHKDPTLASLVPLLLRARPAAISFVAANPRHEHEWKVFETVKLPPGKILVPGVIDSTTNFIEHPELVAERIVRLAKCVGRENVIAGTDCGFGTFAGYREVEPDIAWAKLRSLVEGARLATAELWRRG